MKLIVTPKTDNELWILEYIVDIGTHPLKTVTHVSRERLLHKLYIEAREHGQA